MSSFIIGKGNIFIMKANDIAAIPNNTNNTNSPNESFIITI